jgi:alginate O-acetyltransferase complex protein AlgJ
MDFEVVCHRTLQAAIARAVDDASLLRPLLIRINNQIRYSVFGYISTPNIIVGEDRQLTQPFYLSEYCSRRSDTADRRAAELIPRLRDIQAYFESRNRTFVFLITPSKIAHLPEYFVHRFPSPNSEQDRTALLPKLDWLLREAGINVLDAASLIHGLKGTYEVDLFPPGGVHWNAVAVARAADAIVAEVNRLAGRRLMPRLDWTYTVVDPVHGEDLVNLLNLLVTPKWYKSAEVTYRHVVPCDREPENPLKVAIIGTSFIIDPALALISGGCLAHLYSYFYLSLKRYGGIPLTLKDDLNDDDLAAIRDADVAIVEDNETFVAINYLERLRAVLSGR